MSHKAGVKRFVFSSSSSVYGEAQVPSKESDQLAPLSPYAAQKLMGEEYCKLYARLHGMETACLRYFNVFGPRQALDGAYRLVMGIFAQQRLEDKPLSIYGSGEQRRDFTYVGDVVRANILAATTEKSERLDFIGTTFNIGRGRNRSVNDIAKLIGGPVTNLSPRTEPFETLADNAKAWCLLGWEPTVDVEEWVPGWLKEIGL
jgi:UDP-glucose 4-epimerase